MVRISDLCLLNSLNVVGRVNSTNINKPLCKKLSCIMHFISQCHQTRGVLDNPRSPDYLWLMIGNWANLALDFALCQYFTLFSALLWLNILPFLRFFTTQVWGSQNDSIRFCTKHLPNFQNYDKKTSVAWVMRPQHSLSVTNS